MDDGTKRLENRTNLIEQRLPPVIFVLFYGMKIKKIGINFSSEILIGWSGNVWANLHWQKSVIDRPGGLLSVRHSGEISFGGVSRKIEVGDMVVYDALPRHEFNHHSQEWNYYFFHVPAQMIEPWKDIPCNTPVPGVRLVHFSNTMLARIHWEFKEAHTCFELHQPGWEELTGALLQLILARFFQALPSDKEGGKSRLEQVVEHLENYGYSGKLEDLAREYGMSRTVFFRKFRTEYGCSPIEYRDNLVITRAKMLLCSTELQIQEIAAELNFRDPYYFTRFFHMRTGSTPTRYRRKNSHPAPHSPQ